MIQCSQHNRLAAIDFAARQSRQLVLIDRMTIPSRRPRTSDA
jgi:hypothetical protein